MWSKIYVGIIVLVVLLFLHTVSALVHYVDNKYQLKSNYGLPIDCFSTALCAMNGNIFLLFIIYLIIPDSYYEHILKLLDPRELQKSASNDTLGIGRITDKISNNISSILHTAPVNPGGN